MPDEPFRFAISPIVTEKNARCLIDIMAQSFSSGGARCEDLRREFERITGLKRQMFYDTLRYCRYRRWVVGGAKDRREITLNADGSWKAPPSTGEAAGEPLSRDQLEYLKDSQTRRIAELQSENERLRDWSSSSDTNGVNTALTSLLRIVADNGASVRQRIRAAAAVLGYKTEGDIAQFAKKYLTSVCESTDIAFDYRIEAGELLRRHEAPRVTPDSVRPSYRDDSAEPREPPVPLLELVRQRRERADRMQAEMIRQYGWRDNSTGGNRSDEPSDAGGEHSV